MKFGIHNPSWVFGPDPTKAFEGVKAKAQWAEDHGFVWFSVMDHLIQIGGVGAPDEPFMEGWTVLSALSAVTCGSGAFTELLAQRCAPAEIQGIDPSEAQFAFARARPALREATFLRGDAMALPFETDRFDAAVMALVLFFVPDPA